MESIRMLLTVAAQEGWLVHHMDVKSAFPNGKLKEEVYVWQPPGLSLQGTKGSFKWWASEHDMYMQGSAKLHVVVGIYVDDLIITGMNPADIGAFKEEMCRLFWMSDLGLLSYYLRIEVKKGQNTITLGQAVYVKKLLEKAGMMACKPISTPMEVRLKLSTKSTTPEVDVTMYRSLVGSLRYLVHTSPDIAFVVGYVSHFMEKPWQEHLVAVKHLLRYITGTVDYGIVYSKLLSGDNRLMSYSDSDWGGDADEWRSTAGMIFFLGRLPVTWQYQKQKLVALSTYEAEYVAGVAGACQAMWLI
ncbi:uncharacterized mitochondrial protein AtMg00810-like [Miscanthus floridulus]|uniref:uncharacterized mitochondrial protein AtMg00810-like n=1 Tax=Miscanthus floridulus TaxID=154761 RepID=UPI00345AC0E3